jgi:hypothetical protein
MNAGANQSEQTNKARANELKEQELSIQQQRADTAQYEAETNRARAAGQFMAGGATVAQTRGLEGVEIIDAPAWSEIPFYPTIGGPTVPLLE